jgi:hypothetical protein
MGLTRSELWARLGLLREIDPISDEAYKFTLAIEAKQSDQGAAAKDKWHVSFHGSQFEGADEKGCGRANIYRLMDVPKGEFNRRAMQIMDAGKDIEDRLVARWYRAGYLLSAPPAKLDGSKQKQTVFEDPEHWLTSTVDAIVVPRMSTFPIVAEIKTKYAEHILEMKHLIRGPDPKHVLQVKTQLGLAHEAGPTVVQRCHNTGRMAIEFPFLQDDDTFEMQMVCPQHLHDRCLMEVELHPPQHGYIYYVSRDNPSDTHEFFFEYDPNHMTEGRKKLAEYKKAFEDGVLPQTNFEDKRYAHPFGWLWGDQPCKWCDYGDVCRKDMRASLEVGGKIVLEESAAVEEAVNVRGEYDLDLVREEVFQRWA